MNVKRYAVVAAAIAAVLGAIACTQSQESYVSDRMAEAREQCESVEGNTELEVVGRMAYCYYVTVEDDGWRRCKKVPHEIAPIAVPTGGHYESTPYPCGNEVERFCETRDQWNRGSCLNTEMLEYEEEMVRETVFPGIASIDDCTGDQWLGTPTIAADVLWCAFHGYAATALTCEWASGVWLEGEQRDDAVCLVPIIATATSTTECSTHLRIGTDGSSYTECVPDGDVPMVSDYEQELIAEQLRCDEVRADWRWRQVTGQLEFRTEHEYLVDHGC
ncbi:MAG: hypothetical protein F4Y41_05455 [Gammaproteobacteria bacterium]|nr:hypothetical protein [Gammaproteobacteria bacterium]MYF28483.1 hypothetical protein [Gammaproteobacteria bacterium]